MQYLNGRCLGYVAEGVGLLFKQEVVTEDFVTMVNTAALYKCEL